MIASIQRSIRRAEMNGNGEIDGDEFGKGSP